MENAVRISVPVWVTILIIYGRFFPHSEDGA